MIITIGGRIPDIHEGSFIAENAVVMGSVEVHKDAGIWFNAVVRGDRGRIVIGEGSNIQDGCVLHTDEEFDLIVGRGVTVGHRAVLHGCIIGDDSLIGINSVVLNGARIGKNCLIGACTLVTEAMAVPDNSLVLGVPGKVVKEVSAGQIEKITRASRYYIENIKRYRDSVGK